MQYLDLKKAYDSEGLWEVFEEVEDMIRFHDDMEAKIKSC